MPLPTPATPVLPCPTAHGRLVWGDVAAPPRGTGPAGRRAAPPGGGHLARRAGPRRAHPRPAGGPRRGRTAARVGERALVDEVWGPDQPPANPAKALQVVVSRTRVADRPRAWSSGPAAATASGLDASPVDALALRHDVAAGDRGRGPRRPDGGPRPRPAGAGRRGTGIRWRRARWPPCATTRARLRAEAGAVLGRSLSRPRRPPRGAPAPRGGRGRRRGDRRRPAALPGRRARQPRGTRPLRAGAPRPRRPARRRPGARRWPPCTPSCSPPTTRCGRACATSRPPWSVATTTSARCGPWSASRGSCRSSAPAGWARPGSRTCSARRPSSRSCTSSSWSASPRPTTSSARSARPWACATR